MNSPRTLLLDYQFGYGPAEFGNFGSDLSCFDFDLVIWDPGFALRGYSRAYPGEYRGCPSLDESSSVRAVADIARRRKEFKEFVDAGKTLVVLVRPPQDFYFDTGERTHSGTGRNRSTTHLVSQSDFLKALPLEISFSAAGGSNIEYAGDRLYSDLWRSFQEHYRYEAVISGKTLKTLFKIAGTEKIVGGVVSGSKSAGQIILLPAVDFQDFDDIDDDEEESDNTDDATPSYRFQSALTEIVGQIQSAGDVEPLPPWASDFYLTGEATARTQLRSKEEDIERERRELSDIQSSLEEIEQRKILVTGTGQQLENQVRTVLEALGGEVSEPSPGRDDWRVKFPEFEAVVEVKGKKSSAAEKDAAQLEKWASNFFEETGVQPKPILVVNGWRTTPVHERDQAVFPAQMLPYCKSRNHCLITGLQLLTILQEVEGSPTKAEELRARILATKGPLRGRDNWKRSFTLHDSVAADEETKSEDGGSK